MSKHVIIVGTGLGGLATGLRLISNGYQVTFVEKTSKPGGRMNQLKKDGFTFDIGPSFFSMPYEFEELMKDCELEMPFEFMELAPLYTVHFRGSNKKFRLHKDVDLMSEQFEGIEPNFKEKFEKYLKKCDQLYNDTVDIVIKNNYSGLLNYLFTLCRVNPKHLPVLLHTFWSQVCAHFDSKEARQIVSLIAFFLGNTPFDTNGVYTLLSHIEFKHTGYYNVKGGMYTVIEKMVEILEAKGAKFYYNTEIVGFKAKRNHLNALVDQNSKKWQADTFVINADAALFRGRVFQRKCFNEERLQKMKWTMGYLTFYIGLNKKLPNIEHHNYFLGTNYEDYAKQFMNNWSTSEKPYYYVNVISKHNPDCAPEGCEALFFVCPVPNLIYKSEWCDKEAIINSILRDFMERIGEEIMSNIIFKESYTPVDWQNEFNLYKGAGLGLSHSMLQIGGFRPSNNDEQFKNTFYVGASTVPGAGLPMSVISSKLVAERVLKI